MSEIEMTKRQSNAVRKHFGVKLRKLGIDQPEKYSPHALTWTELGAMQRDIRKLARESIELLEDGATGSNAQDIEAANNALMSIHDELDAEMDYRNHTLGAKAARKTAERADPRRPQGEYGECRDGELVSEQKEVASIGIKSDQRFSEHASLNSQHSEYSRLGLGQYMRAMVMGARSDLEKRALSEGTDSAGGFTVPTILSAQLIDLMRAKNQAINAGAVTLPLTSNRHHLAKVLTDPVPAWRGESASVAESDPTFGRVEMEPKSLAVLVRASREVLDDSINIGAELPGIIAAALASELDRAVFMGAGTNSEPQGLDNIAGVQELAHDAAIDSYAPLLAARKLVMRTNAANVSTWVLHPDAESEFGGLLDSSGQPLNYPAILDRPEPLRMLTSTKFPTDLGTGSNETTVYGGDFNQVVIGLRNEVRIEVLRERYADSLEYGFLAFLRADVAAIRPDQLIRITGVQL